MPTKARPSLVSQTASWYTASLTALGQIAKGPGLCIPRLCLRSFVRLATFLSATTCHGRCFLCRIVPCCPPPRCRQRNYSPALPVSRVPFTDHSLVQRHWPHSLKQGDWDTGQKSHDRWTRKNFSFTAPAIEINLTKIAGTHFQRLLLFFAENRKPLPAVFHR
jgi:hypothetical protein